MDSAAETILLRVLERIATALERSNLLQEDSNRINLASVGLQEQQHQENKQRQDEWRGDAEKDRVLLAQLNAKQK